MGPSALFNLATAFEIVEARQGEKTHLVAQRVHPGIDFLASHCALASAVMFRKMGATSLDCPFRPTPS
jgi:hypothetical protein